MVGWWLRTVRDNYNLKSHKYVTNKTLNLILTLILTETLLLNGTQ